jgi:hypothetical protein
MPWRAIPWPAVGHLQLRHIWKVIIHAEHSQTRQLPASSGDEQDQVVEQAAAHGAPQETVPTVAATIAG